MILEIREDVKKVHKMLCKVGDDFKDVKFIHSDPINAMRNALSISRINRCDLKVDLKKIDDNSHILSVRTDTPSFGPQPFLAMKTYNSDYYHDNFDFQTPNHFWTYTFDSETLPIRAIESIGVAVNNSFGITTIINLDVESGKIRSTYLHDDT